MRESRNIQVAPTSGVTKPRFDLHLAAAAEIRHSRGTAPLQVVVKYWAFLTATVDAIMVLPAAYAAGEHQGYRITRAERAAFYAQYADPAAEDLNHG